MLAFPMLFYNLCDYYFKEAVSPTKKGCAVIYWILYLELDIHYWKLPLWWKWTASRAWILRQWLSQKVGLLYLSKISGKVFCNGEIEIFQDCCKNWTQLGRQRAQEWHAAQLHVTVPAQKDTQETPSEGDQCSVWHCWHLTCVVFHTWVSGSPDVPRLPRGQGSTAFRKVRMKNFKDLSLGIC